MAPAMNVNTASEQQLIYALSLTPEEAASVLKYRTDHGDFKSIEDLLKVPNVDTTKIKGQSDNIAFQDVPIAPGPAPTTPKKN
jgi:competence protein ComEA